MMTFILGANCVAWAPLSDYCLKLFMIKPEYYIYTCLESLLIITDQHNMLMFQLVEWILNDNVLSV